MGAVSITGAIDIESQALANGWTSEQLLNLAGEQLGHAIARFFPKAGTVIGYLGKGHNAGDALVALRILRAEYGWEIFVRSAYDVQEFAPLTLQKWDELGLLFPADRPFGSGHYKRPLVLLDGLLGTGASGPMREPLLKLAREIFTLRQTCGARVAAIDLPSGIDPETGEIFPDTITADVTLMIGNVKRGLLMSHAANATGALMLVKVPPLTSTYKSDIDLISPQSVDLGKDPRPFDFHKGMAGRVAIVAGSESYTGAAALAASGALRGGAGLVTLFVPKAAHAMIASQCPPEVILRGYENPAQVLEHRYDALVVGCGLGKLTNTSASGILELISKSATPVVIDADALNLIAETNSLARLTDNHVITPHPGEFARLAPELADCPREAAARQFADRYPSTLLLKGCRTLITRRGESLWCNATGTPAMACGGQGDVIAGVIGARLAAGESTMQAARIGAWACGRGAELALNSGRFSEESLLPTDVLEFLGMAFHDWKTSYR